MYLPKSSLVGLGLVVTRVGAVTKETAPASGGCCSELHKITISVHSEDLFRTFSVMKMSQICDLFNDRYVKDRKSCDLAIPCLAWMMRLLPEIQSLSPLRLLPDL